MNNIGSPLRRPLARRRLALAVAVALTAYAAHIVEAAPQVAAVASSVFDNSGASVDQSSWAERVVELPAGVVGGTPQAAAWEALMGIDGEYAAYAAYGAVIDAYGPVEPYVTIQSEELKHVNALINQLDRFGIAAPPNPYLGAIGAPTDLRQAAENWAHGEIVNIALYDALMDIAASDASVTKVFENLRRASNVRHLPMFQAAAANGGTLTAAQMAAFGGGGGSGGNGNGNGNGNGA